MKPTSPQLTLFNGPSLWYTFPAAVISFDLDRFFPARERLVTRQDLNSLAGAMPENILQALIRDSETGDVLQFISHLSKLLQDTNLELELKTQTHTTPNRMGEVATSYYSPSGASNALMCAFEAALFAKGKSKLDRSQFSGSVTRALEIQTAMQPDQTGGEILKAAIKQGIPFYPMAAKPSLSVLGQGANSRLFLSAASEFDSGIGFRMAHQKPQTNRLLKLMGYPTTRQEVVESQESALRVAEKLGFPVVIKPAADSKGNGVTTGIQNPEDVTSAYLHARQQSRGKILVEKHIEGFDHRITVANGKVIGAICRMPAMVVGNGVHTIQELIEQENQSRPAELKKQGVVKDIIVDNALYSALKPQRLDINDIPEAGRSILLRTNANISTGGTFKDVKTIMHPDNERMAIDIARVFRLGTVGIDFMTTNIARSWKEEGAVIEINETPGVFRELAEQILKNTFQGNARIPSTIIVTNDSEYGKNRYLNERAKREGLGFVGENALLLDGFERSTQNMSYYDKCKALLIDPACTSLMLCIPAEEIVRRGLPLDRCTNVELDQAALQHESKISEPLKHRLVSLLKDCSDRLEFF